MITDADIKKMKKVFATKDDLDRFATKDDLDRFATKDDLDRFATKDDLKSMEHRIQKSIKKVDKKLDETTKHLDRNLNYHHRRLVQLEDLAGVKPPSYVVVSN